MNKTRKILFFDIDGTLITDDGKRYFRTVQKKQYKRQERMDTWHL